MSATSETAATRSATGVIVSTKSEKAAARSWKRVGENPRSNWRKEIERLRMRHKGGVLLVGRSCNATPTRYDRAAGVEWAVLLILILLGCSSMTQKGV